MYNMNKNHYLSDTLRRLRLEAGYTQQNVADALNINRSTYSYYETGKTTPDIQTLKALSRIFSVKPEIFLEDETPRTFSDSIGQRPKKKIFDNPDTIGQLSSKEKSIISMLRNAKQVDIDDILEEIKKREDLPE